MNSWKLVGKKGIIKSLPNDMCVVKFYPVDGQEVGERVFPFKDLSHWIKIVQVEHDDMNRIRLGDWDES